MSSFWSESIHGESTTSRIIAAYPSDLTQDVIGALGIVPTAKYDPSRDDIAPVNLGGEAIRIPSRVYFPEPPDRLVASLSETQKTIVAALYTRHHDGFVRQGWLEEIIANPAAWLAPFVLQHLGEYVIEIINVLASRCNELKEDRYHQFIQSNAAFCDITCRRIVSYWSCYFHWSTPKFADHVAYQVTKEIGLWRDDVAPRLIRVP